MAAKLTRLTHKIAIQLHLVAESCTICSSCSRRPVRELLDTPSYIMCFESQSYEGRSESDIRIYDVRLSTIDPDGTSCHMNLEVFGSQEECTLFW